jgi:tape measure domain-containing protein
MATIQSQLRLNDGMSAVLRSVTSALDVCLSSFEQVQAASRQAIDVQAITDARVGLIAANETIEDMVANLNRAEQQQNGVNRSFQAGGNAANEMLQKVRQIASAIGAAVGINKLLDLSDQMTGLDARLSFIVDDGGSVQEFEDKILASAQRAGASYQTTADVIAKLGSQAGDAFANNDELIAFSEQLNKTFALAGTDGQAIDSVMYNLTQALASGVLRGQDLNAVMSNAMPIVQNIADYMGVTVGEIRQMAADGQLSADVVKNAMFAAAEQTNLKFESIPTTWAQNWNRMKNLALDNLQPVLAKISELANDPRVQAAIMAIAGAVATLASIAVPLIDMMVAGVQWLGDNMSWLGPIVMGIAAAYVVLHGAQLAYNIVQGISNALHAVSAAAAAMKTGATLGEAAATTTATGAQVGLNAALLACPLTWIIMLVIALIVVFVIFTEQITGAIFWLGALFKNIGLWIANIAVGVWNSIKNIGQWFANLGQSIWAGIQNVGAWFGNLGMGIWEVLKACASNVGIAFHNAWVYIQIGFWSMVDVIMQGLKSIAELANKVLGWMGVNIDTSGLDFAAKKIDELNDKKEEYKSIGDAWAEGFNTFGYKDAGAAWNDNPIDWAGGWNSGYNTFDVFQDGWGSEAYNAGAEAGKGIHDSIMGVFDMFNLDSGAEGGIGADGFAYDSMMSELGEIESNTGNTASSMKNMSEDLTYMRDVAEREAINRFTTAEIKVDMSNMTNRLDGDMDVDGVISRFADGITEALSVAAEGVHA